MIFTNKMLYKGSYRWFHHTITIIEIDENGMPLISINSINDIDDIKTEENINVTISKINDFGCYETIFEKTI